MKIWLRLKSCPGIDLSEPQSVIESGKKLEKLGKTWKVWLCDVSADAESE